MDEKIDIVYLWCDLDDPVFRVARAKYASEIEVSSLFRFNEASGDQRFLDNDELKYSLRSLEKHAPWINHIYLVTADQKPAWLRTDNPKLTLVSHRDILPAEVLPTFNSSVIETALHNIPNLSEFFLFSNDDMFFGSDVTPSFFFTDDGKPIVRGRTKWIKKTKESLEKYRNRRKSLWNDRVIYSMELVLDRLGDTLIYLTHHNIDSYRKSLYREAMETFKEECDFLRTKRFRFPKTLHRTVVSCFSYAKGAAVFKKVRYQRNYLMLKILPFLYKGSDSYYRRAGGLSEREKTFIRQGKFSLFCLNDTSNTSDSSRRGLKDFLQTIFPEPSQFEKC